MNKIGVYLHIPFCLRRCLYCDFYSTSSLSLEEDYVAALCRHIGEAKSLLPALQADTVYFGGGTPSLLKPSSVERLLAAIHAAFPIQEDGEITLETNPATVDKEKLSAFKALGINRISLGIQSTNDMELSAIGRLHSAKEALDCAQWICQTGFSRFSADLMYALPHQSHESFCRSLSQIAHCGADHVSAYCLTLSEQVPLAKHPFPQADEEGQRAMYLEACSYLEQEGFERYEISNFAKPRCRSRHNEKYWLRHPTLAFGPGAYSFFADHRWAQPADLSKVLSHSYDQLICEHESLSREDVFRETLMLSLRRREGLDYQKLLALDPEAYQSFQQRLQKKLPLWRSLNLIHEFPEGCSLTHEGAFVSNTILSDLM